LNIKQRIQHYPKIIWLLAIGMTINTTGLSFLWPLNTIYITEILNQTMTIAGIILMFQQGAGIIGNLTGGWLFDNWGPQKTIIIGISSSAIFVALMGIFPYWWLYLILMLLFGFSTGLIFPSMYAMAGSVWPEGGRKAFNMIYVAQNLGVALGATLSGVVAQISFHLIFIVNAITFLLFLILILKGFTAKDWEIGLKNATQQRDATNTHIAKNNLRTGASTALIFLSIAFIFSWIPYVQWQTSISKYISTLGIDLSKYTLLWTINGALIVLGQPFVTFITKNAINTIKKQMMIGVLIFVLAFLILFNNTLYSGFLMAMVVMTFAEMLVWPAVPAAAADLAPKDKKGFYQGVVSSSAAAGRMLGFLLGGLLYDIMPMNQILTVMIFFIVISGVGFLNYDKMAKKRSLT